MASATAISAFDKSMDRMDRKVTKWLKEDYKQVLDSVDTLTRRLSRIRPILDDITGRDWLIYLRLIDQATDPAKEIINRVKREVYKARSDLTIGVKFNGANALFGTLGNEIQKIRFEMNNLGAGSSNFTALQSNIYGNTYQNPEKSNVMQVQAIAGRSIEKPDVSGKKIDSKSTLSLDGITELTENMAKGPETLDTLKKFYKDSALLAKDMGAGDLGTNDSLPTPVLSGLGMAAQAGGTYAAETVLSAGSDLMKGIQSEDQREKEAFYESAGEKIGGVAVGAATGAALGSIIPGVGTLVGGLIGAGIGAFAGSASSEKTMEEYEEETKKAAIEAEQAKYKSKELRDAIADSTMTAEEFGRVYQKAVGNDLAKRLGSITLSMKEMDEYVENIVFHDQLKGIQKFTNASKDAEQSLQNLNSINSSMEKMNWKAGKNGGLSEAENEQYLALAKQYGKEAQLALENQQYASSLAFGMLLGGNTTAHENLDRSYENRNGRLSTEQSAMEEAIKAGETEKAAEHQQNIMDLVMGEKTADMKSQMETDKGIFSIGDLSKESYEALLQNVNETANAAYDGNKEALNLIMKEIELMDIDDDEKKGLRTEALSGYENANKEVENSVDAVALDAIVKPFENEFKNIFPDLKGEDIGETIKETLVSAAQSGKLNPDDPIDIGNLLGISQDNVGESYENIINLLTQYMQSLPDELTQYTPKELNKQQLMGEMRVEEADARGYAGDFDPIQYESYRAYMGEQALTREMEQASSQPEFAPVDFENTAMTEMFSQIAEQIGTLFNTENLLANATQTSYEPQEIPMTEQSYSVTPTVEIPEETKDLVDQDVKGMVDEAYEVETSLGINVGYSLNNPSASLSFTTQGKGDVSVQASISGGRKEGIFGNIPKFANGGVVDGPLLSMVGEDGPEAIIPLGSKRRSRGLSLWAQAGEALGITQYADGGIVGDYSGAMFGPEEEDVPLSSGENSGQTEVKVEVNVSPTFEIKGSESSGEDVMEMIKTHMKEMADTLGGTLAGKLEAVFSNMPVKEV